jgi:hypothetical protein
MNHEDRLEDAEVRSRTIVNLLQGVPGVKASLITNVMGHQPFGVDLEFSADATGLAAQDIVERLKAGDPPIWTRVRPGEEIITIHMFGLNKGEEEVVGRRIKDLLTERPV